MRFLLALLLALFIAPTACAAVTVPTPADDVGLPFWCDRGSEWDKRCYRDPWSPIRLPTTRRREPC